MLSWEYIHMKKSQISKWENEKMTNHKKVEDKFAFPVKEMSWSALYVMKTHGKATGKNV